MTHYFPTLRDEKGDLVYCRALKCQGTRLDSKGFCKKHNGQKVLQK